MRRTCWIAIVMIACGGDDGPGSATTTSTSTTTTTSTSTTTTTSTTTSDGADTTGADDTADGSTGDPPGDVWDSDRVLNIAHAGGKGTRPEHTMIAYETARRDGADVLEIDVHATADGVLVLMHDATVDRTTDGTGAIKSMTYDELSRLDAGYWFTTDEGATYPYRGMGLYVPTLQEVFEAHPDIPYVLEIKQSEPSIVAPVLAMCDEHGISDQMIGSAFDQTVLLELRAAAPDMPTSFAVPEVLTFMGLTRETEASYDPPARFLQVPLEQIGVAVLTPELVERAKRFDLEVHAWTINDEAEMQMLIDLGVDGIITDFPARLAPLVAR